MSKNDEPLSKQQLFVHPISILEKEKAKHSSAKIGQHIHIELHAQTQPQNFNQLLLATVDPATQSILPGNHKTKHIFKKQTAMTPAQKKQKHYRTSMCPQGIECKKRLVCQFAHTQYELRRPYKNRKNPCIRYQKGLCGLGSACPDYHGNMDLKKKNYNYKVEKCKEWEEKGSCPKGKLCIFIHDENDIEEESEQSSENLQEMNFEAGQQKNEENYEVEKGNGINENENEKDSKKKIETKLEVKDIFGVNQQKKKTIKAKQVFEQVIETKQVQPAQTPDQQQNFNIEFTF